MGLGSSIRLRRHPALLRTYRRPSHDRNLSARESRRSLRANDEWPRTVPRRSHHELTNAGNISTAPLDRHVAKPGRYPATPHVAPESPRVLSETPSTQARVVPAAGANLQAVRGRAESAPESPAVFRWRPPGRQRRAATPTPDADR